MNKLRLYIATASNPLEEAERRIADARAAGFEITHDWTKDVRSAGNASLDDPRIRTSAAKADLRGVETADVVWLIQPENASTGAWVELGYALALKEAENSKHAAKRPRIVVSGASTRCIFADLADDRFTDHDDAFVFIRGMLGAST